MGRTYANKFNYTYPMTDYIPTSQIYIPEGMIDLGAGDPDFSLLPLDILRRAADACFAKNDPNFLQYGAEQGDGYFRMALAGFLSRGYPQCARNLKPMLPDWRVGSCRDVF